VRLNPFHILIMFNTLQLIITLIMIVLLVPQTTKLNLLLRKFYETGVFRNWREAKKILNLFTWGGMFTFLAITYFITTAT
jgi:hypothetical protein